MVTWRETIAEWFSKRLYRNMNQCQRKFTKAVKKLFYKITHYYTGWMNYLIGWITIKLLKWKEMKAGINSKKMQVVHYVVACFCSKMTKCFWELKMEIIWADLDWCGCSVKKIMQDNCLQPLLIRTCQLMMWW